MNRARWIIAVVAVLASGAACSNDPTGVGGGAGTLVLRLSSPHDDDGAVRFEVRGRSIGTATAVNGSIRLFTRRVDASTVVGVVVGVVASGAVVTLQVPDVDATGYTARVLEVADRGNSLRESLSGYALTVAP